MADSMRCPKCRKLLLVLAPADGKAPRSLKCVDCDKIDPLDLPELHRLAASTALRPPQAG
jgi:phage FluMu protein Com